MQRAAAFGQIIGIAPGAVSSFSCDADSAPDGEYNSPHEHDGLYYGVKYQCVEFARRWLIHNLGLSFGSVRYARDVFALTTADFILAPTSFDGEQSVPSLLHPQKDSTISDAYIDNENDNNNNNNANDIDPAAATATATTYGVPYRNVKNGSSLLRNLDDRPVPGSILIWKAMGKFTTTGHIAIVTEVSFPQFACGTDSISYSTQIQNREHTLKHWVRIAEQNRDNCYWPPGQNWSRQLPVLVDECSGTLYIDAGEQETILGWKLHPVDFSPRPVPIPAALRVPAAAMVVTVSVVAVPAEAAATEYESTKL
jgi:glutathionylspermidine amidase/synthetase